MEQKRILVVDDEHDITEPIKNRLVRRGYRAFSAANGKEALEVISNNRIDLVVTDVIMPVMDGVDLFRALRANPLTSQIPVIILSAKGSLERSFRTLGVDDFLSKPFDGEELLKKIEALLNRHSKSKKVKVIVSGNENATLPMCKQLDEHGFIADHVEEMPELIAKVLTVTPDIVLIDILQKDIHAKEVIKALRSFSKLQKLNIILYTQFSPETLRDTETVELLKESKDGCLAAGANHYIGRYTSISFIQSIREKL